MVEVYFPHLLGASIEIMFSKLQYGVPKIPSGKMALGEAPDAGNLLFADARCAGYFVNSDREEH